MHSKLIIPIFLIGLLSVACSPVQAAPDTRAAPSDIVMVERSPSPPPGHNPMAEATASVIAQEIILQAMRLIGVRYQWGGNTPETGLDCSGFIRYVFQQTAKVALPRTAHAMSQIGKVVDRQELQPGDLVFFNTLRRQFSHVGIYLGDNRFIHSPAKGKTITIADLNQKYWVSRYNGARRLNRETLSHSHPEAKTVVAESGAQPTIKIPRYQQKSSRKTVQSVKTKTTKSSKTNKKSVAGKRTTKKKGVISTANAARKKKN